MKNGRIKIRATRIRFLPDNSKQLIEVENETYPVIIKDNEYWILLEKSWNICKDSQLCEVEIKDNKATIISIIKE